MIESICYVIWVCIVCSVLRVVTDIEFEFVDRVAMNYSGKYLLSARPRDQLFYTTTFAKVLTKIYNKISICRRTIITGNIEFDNRISK